MRTVYPANVRSGSFVACFGSEKHVFLAPSVRPRGIMNGNCKTASGRHVMTPDKAIDEIKDIAENVFRPNALAADRETPPLLGARGQAPSATGVLSSNIRLLADRGY